MAAGSCAERSQGHPGAALHAPVHAHHQGHRARFSDPRRAAKIDSEEPGQTGSAPGARGGSVRSAKMRKMKAQKRPHLVIGLLVCGANALCVDPPRGSNLGTPGVAPDTVFPPDSSMGTVPLSVSTLKTVSGAHGAGALETARVPTRRRLMWSRGTADTSP